ncbi:asparaginyl-tRNA synthetase [Ramicandelaber brevisporus]|nr:asparaginyl-tRNA synthetase [Ramicandelaber brevisporus]
MLASVLSKSGKSGNSSSRASAMMESVRRRAIQYAFTSPIVRCPSNMTMSLSTLRRGSTPAFITQPTVASLLNGDVGTPAGSEPVTVKGWVRSSRHYKQFSFTELTDGSSPDTLQVVVSSDIIEKVGHSLSNGACIQVTGTLVDVPPSSKSAASALATKREMRATSVEIIGSCDAESFPLQKKRLPLEVMRNNAHLRARSRLGSSVLRVRDATSRAIHSYFHSNKFVLVNTPILTSHDCEGGGEVFQAVTSVKAEEPENDSGEFFGKPVFLTVSGQLHLEAAALGLSRAYTFGPVFRAEPSMTSRHLAEFWMVEAEAAFVSNVEELCGLASNLVRETVQSVLDTHHNDITAIARITASADIEDNPAINSIANKKQQTAAINGAVKESISKHLSFLERIATADHVVMSYTEAIDALQAAVSSQIATFEHPVEWGVSLKSEHERYLADIYCNNSPVCVTDYPTSVKPFYMLPSSSSLASAGNETVACFDMLIPGLGELVGGSMREHRHVEMKHRLKEAGLNEEEYKWYLDLREYGAAPHGGFGIGFERLVRMITGVDNLRDVVPFPRTTGKCLY